MSKNKARKIFLLPVKGYQKFISPALKPSCIYTPTCSEFFYNSVMKFGIIRGTLLGTARILRCNRFFMGGPDPVPDEFSFKQIKDQYTIFKRPVR